MALPGSRQNLRTRKRKRKQRIAEALKEEIAQGKVKVSTEGEKVVVELQESIEAKNA